MSESNIKSIRYHYARIVESPGYENILIKSCINGDKESVKNFLQLDTDYTKYRWMSAFYNACLKEQIEIVKLMSSYGKMIISYESFMQLCKKSKPDVIAVILDMYDNDSKFMSKIDPNHIFMVCLVENNFSLAKFIYEKYKSRKVIDLQHLDKNRYGLSGFDTSKMHEFLLDLIIEEKYK